MQRTYRQLTDIQLPSLRPNALRIEIHQRIQHWIQPLDLRNMRLS